MPLRDRLPAPPRREASEWLDDLPGAGIHPSVLAESLREVWRLNRLVGATRVLWSDAEKMLPPSRATLLDVGTGAADTPIAFLKWGSEQGLLLDITGLDLSPDMLDEARRRVADRPVTLVKGDARHLPFADASFDVVTALGVLHHFDEADASRMITEMWRVARAGIVVVDLERSYATQVVGTWALRVLTRNPLTRHDGLISIRRSYTLRELGTLAEATGLRGADVRRRRAILVSLSARKG